MISEVDKAYIAGLFDGEGSIHFKRGLEKKKKHKGKQKNNIVDIRDYTRREKSV